MNPSSVKLKIVQSSWAHGKVSPKVFARNDSATQAETAAEISNYIILQQGGLEKRPGFRGLASGAFTMQYYFVMETQYGRYLIHADGANIYSFNIDDSVITTIISNTNQILNHAINGNAAVITFNGREPLEITNTALNTWTTRNFFSNISVTPYAPYLLAQPNFPGSVAALVFGLQVASGSTHAPFTEGDGIVGFLVDASNNPLHIEFDNLDMVFAAGYNLYRTYSIDSGTYFEMGLDVLAESVIRTDQKDITVNGIAGSNVWGFSIPISQVTYGAPIPPINLKYCTFYQNRLWFGYNNIYFASRTNAPFDYQFFRTDDAAALQYSITNDGSMIIGMDTNDTIYIYTNKGVFALLNQYNQTITPANFNMQKLTSDIKTQSNIPIFYRNSLFFATINGNVIGLSHNWYTGKPMMQIANILIPEIVPYKPFYLFTVNDNKMLATVTSDGKLAILQFIPEFTNAGQQLQFMPPINQMAWAEWEVGGDIGGRTFSITDVFATADLQLYIVLNNEIICILDLGRSVDLMRTGDTTINLSYVNRSCAFNVDNVYTTKTPINATDYPPNFDATSEYGLAIWAKEVSRPYSVRLSNGMDTLFSTRKLTELMLISSNTLLPFYIILPNGIQVPVDINKNWTIDNQIPNPAPFYVSKDKSLNTDWDYASQLTVLHNQWGSATLLAVSVELTGAMQ